ncbi:MAG: hypothetical protein L0332_02260 [Chloroflexi bacterium]|nr:hypothetical protein [Chloroflexota bacterium]MCI0577536.1 hypothetical protein [Chloroflexota bacterium]MCI0645625.1 hypothetical protein [Chloroflexota bacterium]MCI0725537.1 hypothetical protein [Chloroflexota bacterium]
MRFSPLGLVAVAIGGLSLVGLLLIPGLGELLTGWAALLAAVALLLGVINLLRVHLPRAFKGNGNSLTLVLGLLAMVALGVTDSLGLTEGWVQAAFILVQAPLEAALAALLAFFLLFAGMRLLQRQRSWWALLFMVTVILVMLGQTPMPAALSNIFIALSDYLSLIFVSAGTRGILIGVALGAILVSLRVLLGLERPYDK